MSQLAVLYEEPGPRGKLRNKIISAFIWVAVIIMVAYIVYSFYKADQLTPEKWEPFLYADIQKVLFEGIINTLLVAVAGSVGAIIIGITFALLKLSNKKFLRIPAVILIEFFRGLPVLLIMFAFFMMFDVSAFFAVAAGLAVFNGMVLAEVFRAGIQAVPKGQKEAGLSIGLSYSQTMRVILLPQAFKAMLPTIIAQLIVLLKDSALGYIVSFHELVYAVNQVGRAYHNLLPAFIVGAAIFIVINLLVYALAVWIEKTLAKSSGVTAKTASKVQESIGE